MATAAERVVHPMSGDHAAAPGNGNGDLRRVRRKTVAQVGPAKDKGQSERHEGEDGSPFVTTIAAEQGDGPEQGDEDREQAVGMLLRGQIVGRDGGERK